MVEIDWKKVVRQDFGCTQHPKAGRNTLHSTGELVGVVWGGGVEKSLYARQLLWAGKRWITFPCMMSRIVTEAWLLSIGFSMVVIFISNSGFLGQGSSSKDRSFKGFDSDTSILWLQGSKKGNWWDNQLEGEQID